MSIRPPNNIPGYFDNAPKQDYLDATQDPELKEKVQAQNLNMLFANIAGMLSISNIPPAKNYLTEGFDLAIATANMINDRIYIEVSQASNHQANTTIAGYDTYSLDKTTTLVPTNNPNFNIHGTNVGGPFVFIPSYENLSEQCTLNFADVSFVADLLVQTNQGFRYPKIGEMQKNQAYLITYNPGLKAFTIIAGVRKQYSDNFYIDYSINITDPVQPKNQIGKNKIVWSTTMGTSAYGFLYTGYNNGIVSKVQPFDVLPNRAYLIIDLIWSGTGKEPVYKLLDIDGPSLIFDTTNTVYRCVNNVRSAI